jgi:CRISPR/Cas system-associated exonuclease Cas4 (RecB family)
MNKPFKLSPSDLTFLWDECPRCFYLKVVENFYRPALPFPKIFNQIDRLMKDFFDDLPTEEMSSELPPGNVAFSNKWVNSAPITFPHHSASCYIRGIFDTILQFSDGTYAVVDFKTTKPKEEHIPFYSRQLHAYAYALEHQKPGSFNLNPITRMGLLCVEPIAMSKTDTGNLAYEGNVTWLEIPKNEHQFLEFLDSILDVLESSTPPDASATCKFCQYRENSRKTGY